MNSLKTSQPINASSPKRGYLKLEGITKGFPAKKGFNPIVGQTTLSIDEGQFVSIIGPSGCGKSTILNMIAGLTLPDEGRLLLDGLEVTGPGRDRGMVFQQHVLLPWMTARQNVVFALECGRDSGGNRREYAATADHYLDLVHLGHAKDRRPAHLSGGMQQRVGLARAFALHPKVLLLDEPLGALDALTRRSLQLQLLKLCEHERKTFVMVTHDVDEALLLSDRIVVMGHGPNATVKHDLAVPFARPRDAETLDAVPEYHQLRSFLLESLTAKDEE